MKYRKKPIIIEASEWWKNGDHPDDGTEMYTGADGKLHRYEGEIVRYYRHPEDDGERACEHCNMAMHYHGWIDTLEGGHTVCPGDYIITGIQGENYPCKPYIFAATYEAVSE